MKHIVTLTQQEHSALILVLIEAIRDNESTQEFVDVLTDHTITLADLLKKITNARMEK